MMTVMKPMINADDGSHDADGGGDDATSGIAKSVKPALCAMGLNAGSVDDRI